MLLGPTCSVGFRGRSCLGLLSPLLGVGAWEPPIQRGDHVRSSVPLRFHLHRNLEKDGSVTNALTSEKPNSRE